MRILVSKGSKTRMVTTEVIQSHPTLRRSNEFVIDLDAIAHNVRVLRGIVGSRTWLCVAVKANAYGFGLREVSACVIAAGADSLALADVADAVELRESGVTQPILLYPGNIPDPNLVREVEARRLTPTVVDLESAKSWSSNAREELTIFVKVDVGLERLGIPANDSVKAIADIVRLPRLRLGGVYTHLHVVDGDNAAAYANWQFKRFNRVLANVKAQGIDVPVRMAAASAALRMSRKLRLNAVDPGHLIYGLLPAGPGLEQMDLRPAFVGLQTRVIQVKDVHDREFADHLPFQIRKNMRIGVLPIGSRDGMASLHCGQVLVGGRRVEILGTVSLEHTRIDLTDAGRVQSGDPVVIIGTQGGATISLRDVMVHQLAESPAALALEVRDSVRRVYLRSAIDHISERPGRRSRRSVRR